MNDLLHFKTKFSLSSAGSKWTTLCCQLSWQTVGQSQPVLHGMPQDSTVNFLSASVCPPRPFFWAAPVAHWNVIESTRIIAKTLTELLAVNDWFCCCTWSGYRKREREKGRVERGRCRREGIPESAKLCTIKHLDKYLSCNRPTPIPMHPSTCTLTYTHIHIQANTHTLALWKCKQNANWAVVWTLQITFAKLKVEKFCQALKMQQWRRLKPLAKLFAMCEFDCEWTCMCVSESLRVWVGVRECACLRALSRICLFADRKLYYAQFVYSLCFWPTTNIWFMLPPTILPRPHAQHCSAPFELAWLSLYSFAFKANNSG